MSQRQHFLNEIISRPDDDQPRLVYADWLEDRGDPRAEFIRVQCELANLESWEPEFATLLARSDALLEQNEMAWKKELGLNATQVKRVRLQYGRGMIEQMRMSAKAFSEIDPLLLKTTPITKVRFTHTNGDKLNQVLDSGVLEHIRGLKIKNLVTDHIVLILKACSPQLRLLDLGADFDFSPKVATAIANASFAHQLTSLSLIGAFLDQDFFTELASQGGLPKLERLEFGGGMAVARPYRFEDLNLKQLRSLRVGGKLRIADTKELCHLSLNKLTRLNLQGTRPPAAGLKLMLEAGALEAVERVSFKNCDLSKASLGMIMGTPAIHCTHLDLTNNKHVDQEFLDNLALANSFTNLRSVNAASTSVPKTDRPTAFADLPFFVQS